MEWDTPAESLACRYSRTVPTGQLTGSCWRALHHEVKNFPPQVVHFPRRGSSGLENGLYHFSWETRSYELCPLRGHTHSFHNSGRGCRMAPPACERRSLLMGTSHGESSRREIRSENHTRPGQYGATNSRRTPSRRTPRQNSWEQSDRGKSVQT